MNARHRSANDARQELAISRLNSPVNSIPDVDGTIWLIAMIQEAQGLDVDSFSSHIDPDSTAASGQHINVPCGEHEFAIDFEYYGATAVSLLAGYTMRKTSLLFCCLTRCPPVYIHASHMLTVGDGRSRT